MVSPSSKHVVNVPRRKAHSQLTACNIEKLGMSPRTSFGGRGAINPKTKLQRIIFRPCVKRYRYLLARNIQLQSTFKS